MNIFEIKAHSSGDLLVTERDNDLLVYRPKYGMYKSLLGNVYIDTHFEKISFYYSNIKGTKKTMKTTKLGSSKRDVFYPHTETSYISKNNKDLNFVSKEADPEELNKEQWLYD